MEQHSKHNDTSHRLPRHSVAQQSYTACTTATPPPSRPSATRCNGPLNRDGDGGKKDPSNVSTTTSSLSRLSAPPLQARSPRNSKPSMKNHRRLPPHHDRSLGLRQTETAAWLSKPRGYEPGLGPQREDRADERSDLDRVMRDVGLSRNLEQGRGGDGRVVQQEHCARLSALGERMRGEIVGVGAWVVGAGEWRCQ